jgi:NADH-quinone oxidoreductase subunit K
MRSQAWSGTIEAASVSPELLVLATSGVLFATGVVGLLLRRNPMAVLMSIELMLNAGNLLLVLGARVRGQIDGQAAALLVLVLAAAEAVIGLALALAYFRNRSGSDVDSEGEVLG